MSATDSDNSIDWLASDYEDNESEQEFDSDGKCGHQTGAPPLCPPGQPHLEATDGGRQVKDCGSRWSEAEEEEEEEEEASSRGSHPSCVEKWDSNSGLCKRQQSEKPPPQQALKRPHSSVEEEEEEEEEEECRERHLLSNRSEKNQIFGRKCRELQCYIHPLSSILNGLRSGRYRERLSSFQESVAMDRIQRIMGVLQNPCLGEKYIDIILKMEEMLKSWFPNVKLQDQVVVTQTEDAAPSKKLKLSPGITTAEVGPLTVSEPPACSKVLRGVDLPPPTAGAHSASNLKWLHASPICSAAAEQAQAVPRHPPAPRDKDLTQDNSVSSSTDSHSQTDPVPRGPPPGKINAPCLERLLKSTESIINRKGPASRTDSGWS